MIYDLPDSKIDQQFHPYQITFVLGIIRTTFYVLKCRCYSVFICILLFLPSTGHLVF